MRVGNDFQVKVPAFDPGNVATLDGPHIVLTLDSPSNCGFLFKFFGI